MPSASKSRRSKVTDFGGEKEAQRLQNIREGVGCPHGRTLGPERCTPCWVDLKLQRYQEDIIQAMLRAEDDGFRG